ncbi:MAG TPA: pyridoxamine 5'-phosphate oxidase family protein [Kofleriaceae bacterium]|jgi:nitroimidazol reductase NimA-like FMN-containing flavoprotein (pyridoxamine 5'-phosphate oxidase superfamily)
MLEQRLRQVLDSNQTVKIATSGAGLSPWIAAAYFAPDGLFCLEVMIESGGNTLANIRSNPQVAVMIDNGDAFAPFAQAEGRAEVDDQDGAAERFRTDLAAKAPAAAPLVGLPNLVPVRIRIETWRLTDVSQGWIPARQLSSRAAPGATG